MHRSPRARCVPTRLRWTVVALALLAALAGCATPRRAADAVYVSGVIYTVDPEKLWVEAVSIRDGRFLVVGSNETVLATIDHGTRIVDVEGAFVMPALYDPDDPDLVVGAITLYDRRDAWASMEERRRGVPPESTALGDPVLVGALDMPAVVRAFTIEAARSRGEDAKYGTIEPGKRASFVVLDRNLFEVPPSEIGETRVIENVIAGEPVPERP